MRILYTGKRHNGSCVDYSSMAIHELTGRLPDRYSRKGCSPVRKKMSTYTRLTLAQKLEIFRLRALKYTQVAIGQKLGITQASVSYILAQGKPV